MMFLIMIPTVFISLSFHELAHGYVAYLCGDRTAKHSGRLTLNPLRHLDLYGTIMMFAFGFGWAKPVPINMRNFRKPKRDLAFVSVAGAGANLILALIASLLFFLLASVFINSSGTDFSLVSFINRSLSSPIFFYSQSSVFDFLSSNQQIALEFLAVFARVNVWFAVFNLLPIPPLDGSKLVSVILPHMVAARYLRLEYYTRYIIIGLFLVSYFIPTLLSIILLPVYAPASFILELFQKLGLLLF